MGTHRESEADHVHETVILDGSWELEWISSPESFEALFPQAIPFMTIDTQTSKSGGSSGCNGYSTSFVLKGNIIRFGDPIATKMACPGNGEQVYFKNLQAVDNFTMQNDLLHLRKGEQVLIRFHRKH
jgi:heat shock protein HslJ